MQVNIRHRAKPNNDNPKHHERVEAKNLNFNRKIKKTNEEQSNSLYPEPFSQIYIRCYPQNQHNPGSRY